MPRSALVLAALLAFGPLTVARLARADVMATCPPGEHVVGNPTRPGAMHHGGFHCEPDAPPPPTSTATPPPPSEPPPSEPPPSEPPPSAPPPAPASVAPAPPPAESAPAEESQGCAATPGAGRHAALALVLVVGALLASRRRR